MCRMLERDYYGNEDDRLNLEQMRARTQARRRQSGETAGEKQMARTVGWSAAMDRKNGKSGEKSEEEKRKAAAETEAQVRNGYRAAKLGERYAYAEQAERNARSMAAKTAGGRDDKRAASVEEMLEAVAHDPNATTEGMWDLTEDYVGSDDGPEF